MVGWHACPDPTCRLEGLVEALDEIQKVSRICYIEWNTIHAEHQEHLPVLHGLLLLYGAARQPSGWSLGSNSAVYNLLLTLPSLDWGDLLAFLQAMLFKSSPRDSTSWVQCLHSSILRLCLPSTSVSLKCVLANQLRGLPPRLTAELCPDVPCSLSDP